ncbi:hypothetical protein HEP_00455200, partial [Hepatocystis sp. ex Piliocolobus tephrosceles]
MEILAIHNNSNNAKETENEKESIIEYGRSRRRWNPYVDNGGYNKKPNEEIKNLKKKRKKKKEK